MNEKGIEAYEKAWYHFEQVGKNPDIDPALKRPNADVIDRGLLNQGQILMYIGRAYLKEGKTQKSKKYIEEAKDIYEEINVPSNVAWTYEGLADIAEYEGDYEKMIKYFQKALFIYQEQGDIDFERDVLNEFGKIYEALGDLEQAKLNYEKSIIIDKEEGDTLSILDNYMNLGHIKIKQKQVEEGMIDFRKALSLAKIIKDSLTLPLLYQSIGQAWNLKNKPDSAIYYFQESIPIMVSQKEYRNVSNSYLNLANIFYENEQQDSALYYVKEAERQLLQNGTLEQKKETYQILSKIHKAKGDFEKALAFHQTFFTYHDSLYTENTQQIAKAERVRQNIDDYKTQEEAATLKSELLTTQNNLYLALAIGLLSLLLLGSYLFFQLRKTKIALENKNQQLADLNATKDKFFGIIAHDIRSPITALDSVGEQMDYYLSKNNEKKLRRLAKRVDTTAKHLTNLLDNLLNWALLQTGTISYRPKSINLKMVSNEIFDLYEPIAMTKKITLENNISTDKMVFADQSALNTVLRNLINNALKFTPENGIVSISNIEKEDNILIEVKDTGIGMNSEKLSKLFALERNSTNGTAGEKGSGLGLMLCKELVELNKGTITASSEIGQGSVFKFSIPT